MISLKRLPVIHKKVGPDFPGETFRVLKEKEEKQYGEYRPRRLVLEAWDNLWIKRPCKYGCGNDESRTYCIKRVWREEEELSMAKVVDFLVVFCEGLRKRHYHETEKNRVTYFAVQWEVNVEGEWKAVIRYDCSHRFSHVDKYDIKGNKTKTALDLSFESALLIWSLIK